MASPSTAILDDAQRSPTETPLSYGGKWSSTPGLGLSYPYTLYSINHQLVPSDQGYSCSMWVDSSFGPDFEAFVYVGHGTASVFNAWTGIVMVASNPLATNWAGYWLLWGQDGYHSHIALQKRNSDASSSNLQFFVDDGIHDGMVMSITRINNTFTIYRDGVSMGTASDSTYPGPVNIGLYSEHYSTFAAYFGGGSLGSATSVTDDSFEGVHRGVKRGVLRGVAGRMMAGWGRRHSGLWVPAHLQAQPAH